MENILPRREARENAFLLAFSQTFGDVPLQEALDTNNECGEASCGCVRPAPAECLLQPLCRGG